MKKVMLLVATEKGFSVLKHLTESHKSYIGLVASYHETGVKKDWYNDIKELCDESGIYFADWNDVRNKLDATIIERHITGMLAISWKYLIPVDLNQYLQDDVIIIHDSMLPKYRGFAPVVTAVLCGENIIGASAIFATNEVDSGDIICQREMIIREGEYIDSIIHRMSDIYVEISVFVMEGMINGTLTRTPQNNDLATYSIWRNEIDYMIDWNKSSVEIERMTRALWHPYQGAFTTVGSDVVRIKKCEIVEKDMHFMIREPGKIWEIRDGKPAVVCGKGMLRIIEAYYDTGERYIFKSLRVKLGEKRNI